MWEQDRTELFVRRAKRFEKRKKPQLMAVLQNLSRYLAALQASDTPETIRFGFLHPEPKGARAIDQRGYRDPKTGKSLNLEETRLYIYPHKFTRTLWLVTIGTKDQQPEDIKEVCQFIEPLE